MKIERRCGSTPAERGSTGMNNCPDVLRLENGDYLVIGKTVDASAFKSELDRLGASVGEDETAVIVPARCVQDAAREIAEALV